MSDWSFHVYNQLTRDDHPQYARVAGLRPTDPVPIGGLVASAFGPNVNTSYSTITTVLTLVAQLVLGQTYQVTLSVAACQQITNASTSAMVTLTDSAALIGLHAATGAYALNEQGSGTSTSLITPAATGPDTFTVQASSASASLFIIQQNVSLIVTRVA